MRNASADVARSHVGERQRSLPPLGQDLALRPPPATPEVAAISKRLPLSLVTYHSSQLPPLERFANARAEPNSAQAIAEAKPGGVRWMSVKRHVSGDMFRFACRIGDGALIFTSDIVPAGTT